MVIVSQNQTQLPKLTAKLLIKQRTRYIIRVTLSVVEFYVYIGTMISAVPQVLHKLNDWIRSNLSIVVMTSSSYHVIAVVDTKEDIFDAPHPELSPDKI